MKVNEALTIAKRFVIYGDLNGRLGSFKPSKARKEDHAGNAVWVIKAKYKSYDGGRFVIKNVDLIIDDKSKEILSFELV